jgi:hypothetical protein
MLKPHFNWFENRLMDSEVFLPNWESPKRLRFLVVGVWLEQTIRVKLVWSRFVWLAYGRQVQSRKYELVERDLISKSSFFEVAMVLFSLPNLYNLPVWKSWRGALRQQRFIHAPLAVRKTGSRTSASQEHEWLIPSEIT